MFQKDQKGKRHELLGDEENIKSTCSHTKEKVVRREERRENTPRKREENKGGEEAGEEERFT